LAGYDKVYAENDILWWVAKEVQRVLMLINICFQMFIRYTVMLYDGKGSEVTE